MLLAWQFQATTDAFAEMPVLLTVVGYASWAPAPVAGYQWSSCRAVVMSICNCMLRSCLRLARYNFDYNHFQQVVSTHSLTAATGLLIQGLS